MNLHTLLATKNECYIKNSGTKWTPKGIMVHSTGANNPNLKRYVGPDDGLLGQNAYGNHWNQYHPDGQQICCHAFIGKLKDGSIATYQILPWECKGWNNGGSSNDTHIAFEICEDDLTDKAYFDKVYKEAVELCVYLCKKYNIDVSNVIDHSEGYKKGIASNHGDVAHWFPKFGKSMSTFRADVEAAMKTTESAPEATKENGNNLTYPLKNMNISQGYNGAYSHDKHSSGTPADYPIDDCGADSGREWFYCPCDEMKVAHIYGVGKNGTNTIWLESTAPVLMPCGKDYVTIQVIHPNDDTLSGIKEGQIYKRGDKMFLEGNDGNATGYHFHIAVGTGRFTGSGWVQNSNGSWVNQTTGKQLKPEEAFWIDDSFTKVLTACGIGFKHLSVSESLASQSNVLYRVQVGAFKNKSNAEALQKQLKAAGYEAIIKVDGDMDGDGKVTSADARIVSRKAVGLE